MTLLAVSTAVWLFILIPLIVVWIAGLVDIVRRDLPRQTKLGWILIVLLLPFVGTILYFALRKPTEKEIELAREAARGLGLPSTDVGPTPSLPRPRHPPG